MKRPRWPRLNVAWSLVVILAIMGAVMIGGYLSAAAQSASARGQSAAANREVSTIRGDFCAWITVHERAMHLEPPDAARRADAASDAHLARQLGCH